MASRKSTGPPPIEIKTFTLQEIDQGISKLKRRVEDVKRLAADRVGHDDQRRQNAEQNIDNTIMEVFGPNSPEYRTNGHHYINSGDMVVAPFGYEPDYQGDFERGIPKTILLLEGLVARLEEKRADLGYDKTSAVKASFEGLDLHTRIASVCADLYRDGHYRNAVQDAAIALINLVKERSRRHDLDGSGLMTTVFSKNNPILAFNDRLDQTELDEQEGMMHLFVGAVMALRNPRSHALKVDSAEEALENIAFLSLLAKRIDKTKRTREP